MKNLLVMFFNYLLVLIIGITEAIEQSVGFVLVIPLPKRIFFKFVKKPKKGKIKYGVYKTLFRVILINMGENNPNYIKTVRHEVRHLWQHKNYPEIFRWFCHKRNSDLYRKTYDTVFNIVEEDARMYSMTKHGLNLNIKQRDLDVLQHLDYESIRKMPKEEQLRLMQRILYRH